MPSTPQPGNRFPRLETLAASIFANISAANQRRSPSRSPVRESSTRTFSLSAAAIRKLFLPRQETSGPTMCDPENSAGHSIPFPTPANSVTRLGPKMPGSIVVPPIIGPAWLLTPNAELFMCPPGRPRLTSMARIAWETIYSPTV